MRMINNLKTRTKLISLVVIMSIFMLFIGLIGAKFLGDASTFQHTLFEKNLLSIQYINEVKANAQSSDALTLRHILSQDEGESSQVRKEIDSQVEETAQLLKKLKEIIQAANDQTELADYTKLETALNAYQEKRNEVLTLSEEKNDEAAYHKYHEVVGDLDQINEALITLAKQIAKDSQEFNEAQTMHMINATNLNLIIIAVVILFSITMGIWLANTMVRQLKRVVEELTAVANGDLTIQVKPGETTEEFGQLQNAVYTTVMNLRGLIGAIKSSSQVVSHSSQDLIARASETVRGTKQVAVSIHEVAEGAEASQIRAEDSSRAIDEMAVGIQRIVENASVVGDLANTSVQEADQGNESIKRVISQMNSISQSVGGSARVVKELGERSVEIEQIVAVITGIASQTNLLALNAAIEADRAGEQGKGFAVVADEVRKLAEQSQESGRQIAKLIHEIQQQTEEAVQSMQKGTVDVTEGLVLVNESGDVFQRIVRVAKQVAEQIQDVSAATEEMSAGSEEMAASMSAMARISVTAAENAQAVASSSEEQLATMEEITASAENLNKISQELESLVEKFRV